MKTYEEMRKHKQDFNIKYLLYPQDVGGRKITYQHLRCDFAYEGDDIQETGIYMIHPEFLDEFGVPIEEDIPVPLEGRASMWILVDEMREKIHKKQIKVGTKGYFMEGARRVGEVVVDEVVGLYENGL